MTTKSQYRLTNIPIALYDPILGQYEKTTIDSLEHFLRNEFQGVVTVDSLQQTKSTLVARVSAPASIADRVITLSGHRLHVGDQRSRAFGASWHMIGYVSGLPELLAQNSNMAISVLQAMLNSVESENYIEVRHLRYDPTVLKLFADVEGASTSVLETIKRRSFPCCGGVVRIKPSVQMNRSGPTAPLSARSPIPRSPSGSDGCVSRSTSASSLSSLGSRSPSRGDPHTPSFRSALMPSRIITDLSLLRTHDHDGVPRSLSSSPSAFSLQSMPSLLSLASASAPTTPTATTTSSAPSTPIAPSTGDTVSSTPPVTPSLTFVNDRAAYEETLQHYCRSECVAQNSYNERLMAACDTKLTREMLEDACDHAYEHWLRLLRLRVLLGSSGPVPSEQHMVEYMTTPIDPHNLMRILLYQERVATDCVRHELMERDAQLGEIKKAFRH